MSGIAPKKPTSIWKRPIQVKFGDLATALGKVAITGAFGLWPETASGGVDVLAALGIQVDEVGAVAWMLVQRSLLQAMSELTGECKTGLSDKSPNFKLLCEQLDHALANSELSLTPEFFNRPKQLPVIKEVQIPFRQWLQAYGLSPQQAQSLAARLPRYFVFALNEQWRANPTDYVLLQQSLGGPFEIANERELAWMRYAAWLQRRVDEPMFAEAFGLRQVYIPLRAYYENNARELRSNFDFDVDHHWRNGESIRVVDLQSAINNWLDQTDKDDAIRIICGGPGCGKSSFGRMLAAHLTETEKLSVLFVPLHQFDPSVDLIDALNNFLRTDLDNILPPNPLEKGNAERQLLLIFDGLDELAMQGKVADQVAQDFVREIQKKLLAFNRAEARVFALISGRDLTIQAIKTEFRKDGQILHVLPYFQAEEERKEYSYAGVQDLLKQDQRQNWWQTYGELKGKNYCGMPEELDQGKLAEITSQPLLNYLVALSYDRNEIDFSEESNLNIIYGHLLKQVYQRDWEGYKHPTMGNIEQEDFIRILEEIAIACWHGNGRTTTVKSIANRCAGNNTLKRVLEIFEGGASEGITRLLTAFYFRQSGIQGSEATFEFTHKSFGEYLTARRMVFGLKLMQQQLSQHRVDSYIGWNEKECLKQWIILCGSTRMDKYLLSFLRDEIKLQALEQVQQWQHTLCDLVGYMLRQGMPLEELNPRSSFLNETKQARNASEALLASLSCCALFTTTLSIINWPSSTAFGSWLIVLQGQRVGDAIPFASNCLNHLNLQNCTLNYRDLIGAVLTGSKLDGSSLIGTNLKRADLEGASLTKVNLEGANLEQANLIKVNLEGASLENANLVAANLTRANLVRALLPNAILDLANFEQANLEGANFYDASLEEAIFVEANLEEVSFEEANLSGADFEGANLEAASFEEASLVGTNFKGVSLIRANLKLARLVGVSFVQARLEAANFEEASLEGVNFERANLCEANLANISCDENTQWQEVQGLEDAKNVPPALEQRLGLGS
jgi:uncharacterized protein YjbI with pentapeptide repeats